MPFPSATPVIAVSACLFGERVRYDGTHGFSQPLLTLLEGRYRLLPYCPEVGMGMGVPRETIRLEPMEDGEARLVGNDSGSDYSVRLQVLLQHRLESLAAENVLGFVVKSRSPSCAAGSYPLDPPADGLFTAALRRYFAKAPILEEDALLDPVMCQHFLDRVFSLHTRQSLRP
jgi:uncharacterized protein YbbK (DUF523 family)